MQKLLSLLLGCLCSVSSLSAQGYQISVTLRNMQSGTLYLGHYMGKTTYVMDSAQINAQGTAVLKGTETLPGGIYLIVLPGKQQYFEMLLDKQQRFAIQADPADLSGATFTGSPDNTLFSDYNTFIRDNTRDLQAKSAAARTPQDSAAIRPLSEAFGKKLNEYRADVITRNPTSLLASLFKAMKEPKVQPIPIGPDGKPDSTYPYRYYKAHYWDEFNLADGRLVRTPILEARLERYFKQLVAPLPDSIIVEADQILAKTKKDKESFKFTLWWLTHTYETSPVMGMDAVFVHLVEKYYVTGEAFWITPDYKEKIISRAYTIAPNLIGQQAAPLELKDTAARNISLYGIKSKYTVVVFWDPTCGHCITEVPKLDSAWKASWKNKGVTMLGVRTDGTQEEWIKFIRDHNMSGWIHAWDPGYTTNYRKTYDVYATPVVYLLDERKKILAKRLGVTQLDEFLQREESGLNRK
ncbi:thioredoxin-like domain-containing protein [Chitinophaga pollutisoli]|uniref:Thioredoxin-like domain-containing protein n=1 Tax=Chitinophaga pollutisoli TaxID=3133966 RepID=A0ABZ2YIA0_9BACT